MLCGRFRIASDMAGASAWPGRRLERGPAAAQPGPFDARAPFWSRCGCPTVEFDRVIRAVLSTSCLWCRVSVARRECRPRRFLQQQLAPSLLALLPRGPPLPNLGSAPTGTPIGISLSSRMSGGFTKGNKVPTRAKRGTPADQRNGRWCACSSASLASRAPYSSPSDALNHTPGTQVHLGTTAAPAAPDVAAAAERRAGQKRKASSSPDVRRKLLARKGYCALHVWTDAQGCATDFAVGRLQDAPISTSRD